MSPINKTIGCDFELANSLVSPDSRTPRSGEAALLLLEKIDGYPRYKHLHGSAIEYGRRFLRGGGSAYIDMQHLEMNLPCIAKSSDFPRYLHAAFRIARRAQIAAQAQLAEARDYAGEQLLVTANNCDGTVSYGNHLRHSISRQAFVDLHENKPHQLQFWATFLVTSVIWSGQGMVGAANGRETCDYQLAQRPDFFSRVKGIETTENRPIVNLRDESHSENVAATHTIYFDRVLSPISARLQCGVSQLVLAMIEANRIDPNLCLDDLVGATSAVSRDLRMNTPLATVRRGQPMTALELQSALCDRAGEFVASGDCGAAVPEATELVALWRDTLDRLKTRDPAAVAGRCDNWLKYLILQRQIGRRGASWQSASTKMLDILFGSLDPEQGLFFQMAAAGQIEAMPSEDEIKRAVKFPPKETRACLRAYVLKHYGQYISNMDWSYIDFRIPQGAWHAYARMQLPDPRAFGYQHTFDIVHDCRTLTELVERVNADAAEVIRRGGPIYDEFAEPVSARPMDIDFE